jgi:hypothetical protein
MFLVKRLDGIMLCFTSSAAIRQLLEVFLKEINYERDKGKEERRDEDAKEIILRRISTSFSFW